MINKKCVPSVSINYHTNGTTTHANELAINHRIKNDTERMEKLFQMYTEMTTKKKGAA